MMTDELEELQEMFKHARAHLEEDIAEDAEDCDDLKDLLKSFKRIDVALQDKKSHQLILDLFSAFSYLDQAAFDCEDDDCDDDMDE